MFATARLDNPERSDLQLIEVDLLVDAGAISRVVPASLLEALAVTRLEREAFSLADGTHVSYDVGEVRFVINGRTRTSPVVFAPEGVTPLLGAMTLESLGLMINPVTRELLPMRLLLARVA